MSSRRQQQQRQPAPAPPPVEYDEPLEEDEGPAPTCARCGGEMVGGELLAQGADRNWLHRTDGPAAAGSTMVAWVCAECGWVDLYVADIDRFLQE